MKLRVLIVEDEPHTTERITDLLHASFNDIEVEAAESQKNAIDLITHTVESGRTYDAVLLDLKLPDEYRSAARLNTAVYHVAREKMQSSVVLHTTAYPQDPEITRFILNETMGSLAGPRSLFLPRTNPSWADDVCRVIEQLKLEKSSNPQVVHDPIKYKSCFISYSHKDETFVNKLYAGLKEYGLDLWYAPARMKPGLKVHEEIEKNVRLYDKFLLVISESSMSSNWVSSEIRTAIDEERESKTRKLIPIRLVSYDKIRKWTCFNADTGKDIAVELREYFIPDFTHWKVESRFEQSVAQLLEAFREQA